MISLGYHNRISSTSVYWLAACIAVSTATHLFYSGSHWMLLFAAAVVGWRCFAEYHSMALPRWHWLAAIAVLIFAMVSLQTNTVWGRDAGTLLILGLTALKFLETRTRRDSMVVVLICYFACTVALLFSQSIANSALVLTSIVLVTGCIVQLHHGRAGPGQLRAVIGRGAALSVSALPLTVALFFFFPRIEGQFGLDLGIARTGLPDRVSPGSIAKLIQSDDIAFRVDFPEGHPSQHQLYWRALAFSYINPDRYEWTETPFLSRMSRHPEAHTWQPQPVLPLERRQVVQQRVTLWPHNKKFYVALDHPIEDPEEEPHVLEMRGHFVLQRKTELVRKHQYIVRSEIARPLDALNAPNRNNYLLYPTNLNSEVVQLGQSWRSQNALSSWLSAGALPEHWRERAEQLGIVHAGLNFFARNGFAYTTTPGTYSPSNPIGEFIFQRRRGFCEHYASAYCLLMRTAGLRSRLIAGYFGGDYNQYGDFYIVRQASAHAWTEVWINGYGWMRVDPTVAVSPARLDEGVDRIRQDEAQPFNISFGGENYAIYGNEWKPEWLTGLENEANLRLQQLEQSWDEFILSYDSGMQLRLMEGVGFYRAGPYQLAALAALMCLMCGAAVYVLLRRKQTRQDPAAEIYVSFCRLLRRRGVERLHWEGPLDFGRRAAAALPAAAAPIHQMTRRYAEIRFGAGSAAVAPADVRELGTLLAHVRKALSSG
ncbi:hypothetical protein DB346_08865 [Verrucomicrobia bacterium LW23]|nr:hypothetical protein DB346_08865 [Verrucomicrobia bacterium LW23]